ncbi:MAG: GTPase, partial [Planctomycetes bacterium]|nr:GTPase [Planctomycetota bacterium]
EQTINAVECDLVLIGTPIDLGRLLKINKPVERVTYELGDQAAKELAEAVRAAV